MQARYKILEELGAGGAGAVYKAYDTQLDRYVAIKRLLSKEESDKGDSQSGNIKKEAASLATLQHPNVVSVFDLGSDEQGFFMVMELVEGDTLADWIGAAAMSLPDFNELATQTLEALVSAHSQSVLHRDLKPENIKVRRLPSGRLQVKVLDFGLARMSYGAKKMTEDQKGNILGSIYYMAPEQLNRKPLDGRTDLYSLGCVLYQALSGRRPFEADTVRGVMEAHLQHLVYPLSQIAPNIPQPVSDWVMWLFNLDASHRPTNAQQALNSLRGLAVAGWLSEGADSVQVAVAVPDEPVYRAPAPGVPRVSTGHIPPRPTGSVSQRITGTVPPRKPTGGVPPRRPTGSIPTPLPSPGRRPAKVEEDEEGGMNKKKMMIYAIGGGLLVVGALAFMFMGGDKPKPSAPGSSGPSIAGQAPGSPTSPEPPPRAANFIQPGVILHYRAGEKMDAYSEPNASVVAAKSGDRVLTWHDLSGAAGDGSLSAFGRQKQNCPLYLQETLSGLKFRTGLLRFEGTSGMVHTMALSNPSAKEYPLGGTQKDPGLTVVMLVRPNISDKDVRCLNIRNSEDKGHLSVRAYPNNEWKLGMKIGPTIKEAKVTGRPAKMFNLVGISWNANTSKMLLSIRTEDGGKGRAEADAPKEKADILNEIRISESNTSQPENLFKGDVVELMVWPYAMGWEERSGQEYRVVQEYFQKPGSRY
ncbi:serine/threonine protein kinase [Roseimicrobium gellanilyticum]|uniref:non-specific serine/threonine protein kinase n=1 Tax=Roseimicrobium gellanilyticum TaxID=748857 RepID=A0A366HPD5_9BACT|nr:protein kinase [Roseimicrobium gellanilyticum]RBP44646.1 serine/threonine protein kinase [Roseimicrobium gellanilyticum]